MSSLVAFSALTGQLTTCSSSRKRQPNVLLVMTDDQGYGDVHSHGNDLIDTPVQDKLAGEGARFNLFYVSPVCAPTRASLLTGRYHLRTGTVWVTHGLETMRATETTIATVLKQAGYATGCFGKWHNGGHYPHHPNAKGFDEFFGFCAGHWNNYFDTELEKNGQKTRKKDFITDVLTDAAIEFITKNQHQPFFCYVPYNAPHGPFQVPDKYFDKYKQRGLNDKDAAIYGMVENVDDNLGRILNKIDELHLREDTIVIFLTDNGPNGQRYNANMRGIKGSIHEGGIRVPCFIRWPGYIQPGILAEPIAAHIDLFPTILALCEVPMPKALPIDGVSLVPLLKQETSNWPDRYIFTHQSRRGEVKPGPGSIRNQKYRLVTEDGSNWELFNMAVDPGQTRNIEAEHPEIAHELQQAYRKWFADVTKAGFGPFPIQIGHPAENPVEMLATEAILNGSLRFKGDMGWANDWIVNWKDSNCFVSWDIEVMQPGEYQVALLYTCAEKNLGAHFLVSAGEASVQGSVMQPHDPAPIFSPDRIPRGEVYEKFWAPLNLGVLRLKTGRQQLTVRAVKIPGAEAIELKAVQLTRI
ncbi:arylsulfatase [candidate division KSB1 bacterium]|nr:arylsulfatase [candidate division KSB1 bacterium]